MIMFIMGFLSGVFLSVAVVWVIGCWFGAKDYKHMDCKH